VAVTIKNKLVVIGNNVLVPGYEPLSEQTTNMLTISMQGFNSYLDVKIALSLIPGSRVVKDQLSFGTFGSYKYFELPDGPPPNGGCPKVCAEDWYKILRDAARNNPCTTEPGTDCDAYDTSKCDTTDYFGDLDPAKRPDQE
jgi:hypothetical protein